MTPFRKYQGRALHGPGHIGRGRGLVVLPYGAGKTWTSLEVARRETSGPVLVFCKSRNIGTWIEEIKLRRPEDCRTVALEDLLRKGTKRKPNLLRASDFDWILVPHSSMAPREDQIVNLIVDLKPTVLIMDESTKIKGPNTSRTGAALVFGEVHDNVVGAKALRMCLTGQPVPESLQNIWAQFAFCYGKRNPLGNTFYKFNREFFVAADQGYAVNVLKRPQLLEIIYNHSFRVTREEWREFAGTLTFNTFRVKEYFELSGEQREYLKTLYTEWSIGGFDLNYSFTLRTKALQICNGFYLRPDGGVEPLKDNPKSRACVNLVKELLEEKRERQILIYTHFKEDNRVLKELLDLEFIPTRIGFNDESLHAFKTHTCTVLLAPAASAEGFNELMGADVAIYYSNVDGSEARGQSEARIARPGQKSPTVTFIDLTSREGADSEQAQSLWAKRLPIQEMAYNLNKLLEGKTHE